MSIPPIPESSIQRFMESAQAFARRMYDAGCMTPNEARMYGIKPDENGGEEMEAKQ